MGEQWLFYCVPVGQLGAYPMGSGHGMAWLEILSARNLYLPAAFCASSLVHSSFVHPLRFMLGPQSYWDTKKLVESVKKGVRVQGFSRQKHWFSVAQWQLLHECIMFVHYSMDAGQSSPEKYHFLPADLLQNPCLDNFKIKFQFPVGWESFLISYTEKKKCCCFVCVEIPYKVKTHAFCWSYGFETWMLSQKCYRSPLVRGKRWPVSAVQWIPSPDSTTSGSGISAN